MNTTEATEFPKEPNRLKSFAKFFKSYISISAVITASLPIPLTAFKLIPSFNEQTEVLMTYTSLFCFLLLAYTFYTRHQLARFLFPRYYQATKPFANPISQKLFTPKVYFYFTQFVTLVMIYLPAIFILLSLYCAFQYHEILNYLINDIRETLIRESSSNSLYFFNVDAGKFNISEVNQQYILNNFQLSSRPQQSFYLMKYYFGIFLFAEAAFILMAIKEYMQDILNFDEKLLVEGP